MAKTKAEIFDELAPLLGEYLEAYGWKAIVIGEKGITKADGKYNYRLIFGFTGGKVEEKK